MNDAPTPETDVASAYLDGEAHAHETAAIGDRDAFRQEVARLRDVRDLVAAPVTPPPADERAAQISKAIDAAGWLSLPAPATADANMADADTVHPPVPESVPGSNQSRWGRYRWRPSSVPALALAAAVMLLVAVGAMNLITSGGDSERHGEIAASPADAALVHEADSAGVESPGGELDRHDDMAESDMADEPMMIAEEAIESGYDGGSDDAEDLTASAAAQEDTDHSTPVDADGLVEGSPQGGDESGAITPPSDLPQPQPDSAEQLTENVDSAPGFAAEPSTDAAVVDLGQFDSISELFWALADHTRGESPEHRIAGGVLDTCVGRLSMATKSMGVTADSVFVAGVKGDLSGWATGEDTTSPGDPSSKPASDDTTENLPGSDSESRHEGTEDATDATAPGPHAGGSDTSVAVVVGRDSTGRLVAVHAIPEDCDPQVAVLP